MKKTKKKKKTNNLLTQHVFQLGYDTKKGCQKLMAFFTGC